MVSIVTKKIKGREYLYLVHSVRDKNKVVQKTIKYIGKKRFVPKQEFECMKMSYEGSDWVLEISDELPYIKHKHMQVASEAFRKYLKNLDKVSRENERKKFLSMFIADSNAIEGSTLSPDDTYNFVFEDIVPRHSTKKELNMASNMIEAWEYLEKNCHRFPTDNDLNRMHEIVNRDIEESETLGKYKKVQNYVGNVKTTSFLFVDEKMDQLIGWIRKALRKINDFEVVFQSHAQFEIIHPYVDGNGRVGRLLLNWLLMYKKIMPLAISYKRRAGYISALRNSQRGKVQAICQFCYEEYMSQYKDMA